MLLVAVAVSSGLTVSCSPRAIGVFDSGWNQMFDAAAQDAGPAAPDAGADASNVPPDAP